MPSFQEKFLATPHPAKLKSVITNDALLSSPVDLVVSKLPHIAKDSLRTLFDTAISAGKEWADIFTGKLSPAKPEPQKLFDAGKYFVTPLTDNHQWFKIARQTINIDKHISDTINAIGDRATKYMLGRKAKNKEIKHSSIVEDGKHVVRLRVLEAYVLAALKEWKSKGISSVKRVELDDALCCSLCLHLNGKEYDIDLLLSKDNPLTFDTHPNCRGHFSPIINNISKLVQAYNKANKEDVTFSTKNLINAPIEYKPWFEQFYSRVDPGFVTEFTDSLDHDYSFANGKLTIKYNALHDEDPREIITKTMASQVPANLVKKTIKDYRSMMALGVVTPPLETSDDNELFTELYQAYMLNQLDDLWEVVWFKTNFDNTKYGKK